MGDMADYYIEDMERGCEDDEYWELYGHTSIQPRKYQTCKYCKSRGLHWQQVEGGKYRLFNGLNKLHECLLIDGKKP